MKKILMIGPVPPPYGGVASVIQDIVHSRLSEEYTFEIFARPVPYPPGTEGIFGKNLFRLRRFARYVNRLRSERFYAVHIHVSGSIVLRSSIFLLPARLLCKRIILHIHGMNWDDFCENRSWFMRFVQINVLSLASRVVVSYALLADNLCGTSCSREVRVLRNRLPDAARPDPASVEEARKPLGLTGDLFVVLLVGDVSRAKGVFDVLEAVPSLAAQDDSVRILVVGQEKRPGEMAAAVQIIRTKALGKWVQLLGRIPRERIPLLIALADTFLLPSHTEAMPISILEAMRAGVPVIASRVGGIPEMIEDGVSGILINPGRPEEIAQAILKLMREPDLGRKLGNAGRKVFEDRFDLSEGVDELRSLYQFG